MSLQTPRLLLRPWTRADAPSLYPLAKDLRVARWAGWSPHADAAESAHVIEHFLQGPEAYAILRASAASDAPAATPGNPASSAAPVASRERDAAQLVGAVELKLGERVELGYWIGHPFWGHGYATEAAAALCARGLGELGYSEIWARYYEGNAGSRRVLEKLGFVEQRWLSDVFIAPLGETRTVCEMRRRA